MQKVKKIPQRQCVGCRTKRDKKDLLRIVKTPEGEIVLDATGKKSGRGVSAEGPQVPWAGACAGDDHPGGGIRWAGGPDGGVMEHILSMIGLAKKAGRVEIGEEPVGSAARSRHARVILVASDAAAGSVRRAYAFAQTGACLCLTIPADKDALGRALGRSSCAMVAVTDVGFADAIVKKLAVMDPEHYEQASQRLQIKARRAMERREGQAREEPAPGQEAHGFPGAAAAGAGAAP